MKNILIITITIIFASSFCEEVAKDQIEDSIQESEEEEVPKRHHEDDKINEKMEQYIKLLEKKRKAIDKFLTENYSDFNHSDYTPEVKEFDRTQIYFTSDIILHFRNM